MILYALSTDKSALKIEVTPCIVRVFSMTLERIIQYRTPSIGIMIVMNPPGTRA